MKYWKYYLVALLVIVIDQLSKWAVHRYMPMGMPGEIPVFGDWFKLHYILNPGMAFGVQLPEPYGKVLLTLFRLVAVTGIGYYIYRLWKQHAPNALIICISLILGGAIGNLVDSIFYGVIYDNAPFGSPTPWLHGQVIDMLYADLYEGILPSTWPLVGGYHLSLWPIFNIADASIFVGVALILLFQNRFYGQHFEAAAEARASQDAAQPHRDAEASEVA